MWKIGLDHVVYMEKFLSYLNSAVVEAAATWTWGGED